MSDAWAVRTTDLGKRYYLGEGEQYLALRDILAGVPRRLLGRGARAEPDSLWALRDVDLEIPKGEVVGILGRNGAGKSTFLKVLSRITHPTTGSVEIDGRVGSLLEVGTGFHPELTGRENVFLNGAILGMSGNEIRNRFDEIVEFSGVSEFLDTPVKRYSTGMYMRLAFAVAAHLEPEILLVDEVLAVGDAEFQRRCLGRMRELATAQGRTVVLVSHNLDAVSQLSRHSIWLDHGRVRDTGPTTEIVDAYLRSRQVGTAPGEWVDLEGRTRSTGDEVRITRARITVNGAPRVESNEPLAIEFDVEARKPVTLGGAMARLATIGGTRLLDAGTTEGPSIELPAGASRLRIELDRLPVAPGSYAVDLVITRVMGSGRKRGVFDLVEGALDVEAHATDASPAIDALVPVEAKVATVEHLGD
ncbi:MAG: polysaccharide ABC transporter ATP-binding protein [Actinomycetota bacterium]